MKTIKALIFDWGNTLMRDSDLEGAMVYWPEVEIIPGSDTSLKELHNQYICCVASNAGASDAILMRDALARVGLRQYFQHFYTSKELGAAKPSSDFFKEIFMRLQVEADECIMIGNDYYKDIVGAKAVGIHTILLAEIPLEYSTPEADKVISSMNQLVETINELIKM